jgi:UDP-N-acetylmuramoyl-L-alanyl-D-glutamate--2,6-diaminopimelate ligase
VPKVSILNLDDENYEIYEEYAADRKWNFSVKKSADAMASNIQLGPKNSRFQLKLPNHDIEITTNLLGEHNISNLLAAISAVSANGIPVVNLKEILKEFKGIPGRLTPVNEGQSFSVVVDFSYKPSALKAVLKTLNTMITGKLIIIFGGTSSRTAENLEECGEVIATHASEVVLTTDDPNDEDPKVIAARVRKGINREEGDDFFEIEDRYEAIRYAIYMAEPNDCVLIAGRGHEIIQMIGNQRIPFDDKKIAQEILKFAKKDNLIDTK